MKSFTAYIAACEGCQLDLRYHCPTDEDSTLIHLSQNKPETPYLRVRVTTLEVEPRYAHERGESLIRVRFNAFLKHIRKAFQFKI